MKLSSINLYADCIFNDTIMLHCPPFKVIFEYLDRTNENEVFYTSRLTEARHFKKCILLVP